MSEHTQDHEARLIEALATTSDQASALAAAGLDHCAECRRSLEDLRDTQSHLDAMIEAEARELASASKVPLEADAAAQVGRSMRAFAGPRPRSRAWVRWAAAALVVTTLTFVAVREDAPNEDLGGTLSIPLLLELESDGYRSFAWRSDGPPGSTFDIVILDYDDPEQTIDAVEGLTHTTWRPDPQRAERWPDRIRWEVRLNDLASGTEDSASSSSSRF